MPNEPEPPALPLGPPCGFAVAMLRQEVARLVAEEDWRALEHGVLAGRYASLGLLPETG